ncbi:CocE/NonD family hydrolase [Sphingomonas lycopersici]|uniref:CocE/NonD family hydrolase n=1 Tax=Sphingomonas lycopersici TaxID=2951807 RepID=A0AA42CVL5_9SPHN|nr:CocE/NonD family hydrolase [Sphingomonas lycopersici]MCW6536718.1 CocE/NonD family hydrolase [Sphingomonas lycopersici]
MLRTFALLSLAISASAFTQAAAGIPPAISDEDERLYLVQRDLQVRTPDGATICALVIRPRTTDPVPAIVEFTIYADARKLASEARLAAAHGYAGVVGLTRGKGCSPDEPVPFEQDGADADTLIDWVARQPWNNGKIGMYGGSYGGFTTWAATKRKPAALKAIMVGAPEGPAIDTPSENGVVWNFLYPWPLYTTNNKTLDDASYADAARWNRLNRAWYIGGRAYRDLDKIDGVPNPYWDRWLSHPTYDTYWRDLAPTGPELASLDIPVLQTVGYFFGGPAAGTWYFKRHYQYRPNAQHYLVAGPWDHPMAQRGAGPANDTLAGYKMDRSALVDLVALRFQWFDYTLRGAPKPALLQDRVNYEMTGADRWKHAPSISAMSNGHLRFYLTNQRAGGNRRLSPVAGTTGSFTTLRVDMADRGDVDRPAVGGVVDKEIDTANGLTFISAPFPEATEMSGLPSGTLDFSTNKRDFDFEIDLYEMMPSGEYFMLAPYWARASQAIDPSTRRLLRPGRRNRIAFEGLRLMSRKVAKGSRLVAVVKIIKASDREINYGSGKRVVDETIADAGSPLEVKWFGDSFVELPVNRSSVAR